MLGNLNILLIIVNEKVNQRSPRSDAEQQMGELGDVFRVCAVAVEKVPLFDELLDLRVSTSIVVPRTELNELLADGRTGHHDDRDLVVHTCLKFIYYVEGSVCHQDRYDFAPADALGPLLALSDPHAKVDFEGDFSAPLEIFVWVVCLKAVVLSRKRCVCPLASSMISTFEGLILGNLISPSGAMPISLTPLLRVNFSSPEASPLSTMTASVLKAALATPAQNLPLPFSTAPIMLMTGVMSPYLNLSSMSRKGRFFLQTLLSLMSLASFPPGNRKSQGFHTYSLETVFWMLTFECCILLSLFYRSIFSQDSMLFSEGFYIYYADLYNFYFYFYSYSYFSTCSTASSLFSSYLTGLSFSLIFATDYILLSFFIIHHISYIIKLAFQSLLLATQTDANI